MVAATLPPLGAYLLQWLLWSGLSPFSWALFYPTVFLSSWLGGFWAGLGATALSTALVWSSFLPPDGASRTDDPKYLVTTALFLGTGFVFSVFNGRLQRATQTVAVALASAHRANDNLELLNQEKRIFEALIENSSDFIGIADEAGRPIYLNPAGRRMVGIPADEPIENFEIIDCYPPELRGFASDVILKTMLEKGHWDGETYFRHFQTGRSIPVSDTHFVIRDPDTSSVLGLGTITRDITDQKRARDLQRDNEEISRLYETARLATQARDDVLAIVAHDLRNPLGTILLHAALLEGERGTDPAHRLQAAAAIRRAATRMNKLIQDLLDVTRMEAGSLTIRRESASATEVVTDVVTAQRPLATGAGIDLVLDVPEVLPAIWADRDRLQQVLENLIGNAIRYTRAGGNVRVAARARADGSDVVFSVADTNGSGIAPDDVPKLFDRFWQARKGSKEGAGLGLPIAKGLVEAHGGRIWVESTQGRGTTFYFNIPVASRDGELTA